VRPGGARAGPWISLRRARCPGAGTANPVRADGTRGVTKHAEGNCWQGDFLASLPGLVCDRLSGRIDCTDPR